MQRVVLILGVLFILVNAGLGQSPFEDHPNVIQRHYAPIVYMDLPQPLGGWAAIRNYIIYPDTALSLQLEGTVLIKCVIDADGRPRDVTALLGPELLFNAAIEAVRLSHWNPARIDGQPVSDTFSFPLDFYLPGTHMEFEEASPTGLNNPLWQIILGVSAIVLVFFMRG